MDQVLGQDRQAQYLSSFGTKGSSQPSGKIPLAFQDRLGPCFKFCPLLRPVPSSSFVPFIVPMLKSSHSPIEALVSGVPHSETSFNLTDNFGNRLARSTNSMYVRTHFFIEQLNNSWRQTQLISYTASPSAPTTHNSGAP
jgi:hypothetical protein